MRTRVFRPIATFISLLLLAAVPAQASPIKFADVVNVMGDLQNGGQLQRIRLRAVAQDPSVSGTTTNSSKSSAAPIAPAAEGDPPDLHAMFEAACLDEEYLRTELRQYSEPAADGAA